MFLCWLVFISIGFSGCVKKINEPVTLEITSQECGSKRVNVIISQNNQKRIFCAEIAKTEQEQARGLMFREKLRDDEGMVFIFDDESVRSFWMKNTLIPLDILFFDQEGKLVDFKKNFQPCKSEKCESYLSKQKAKYVLEINPGALN